jgi:hypothetical protein
MTLEKRRSLPLSFARAEIKECGCSPSYIAQVFIGDLAGLPPESHDAEIGKRIEAKIREHLLSVHGSMSPDLRVTSLVYKVCQ